MQLQSKIKARGHVELKLYGPDGKLKLHRILRNMVVTAGLTHLAARADEGDGETAMGWMAIGSGQVGPAPGDTTLGTELARVALDSSTTAAAVWTMIATFPAGTGTGNVYEAGIFNAGAAGTMLCRLVFGLVTKAAGDTLVINWAVTFADDGV